MKREILNFENEDQWLEARVRDITSTQSAALFGLSKWNTVFELYHAKKGNLDLEVTVTERMEKGKRMERWAAEEVCHDHGFTDLQPLHLHYIRIPELRMGSSFDFECVHPELGPGLLEIKGVDYWIFKDQWYDEDGDLYPPPHIDIQANHELAVIGPDYNWVGVAAFTGIWDHELVIIERDDEMIDGLFSAVRDFWDDVENDREPRPDLYDDNEAIKKLHRPGTEIIDKTEDIRLNGLVSKYDRLGEEIKILTKERKETQSELVLAAQDNKGFFTESFKFTVSRSADTPPTEITEEMVGQTYGGRKGSTRCYVKNMEEKS